MVLSKIQQANDEYAQSVNQSTNQYYLTDMDVGWSDHNPSTFAVMSVADDINELVDNLSN